MVDASGTVAGRMLYDAYGTTLSSDTLSADLTAAITSQGIIPEADTGLTYRGNGRYYDASLGRPLQPNASGGIPVVPQALNRYAATPVGQPGVAAGAMNGLNLWPDVFGLVKGTALNLVEQTFTDFRGQADFTLTISARQLNRNRARLTSIFADGFALVDPERQLYRGKTSLEVAASSVAGLTVAAQSQRRALLQEVMATGGIRRRANLTISEVRGVIARSTIQRLRGLRLSQFRGLKAGLGLGFDVALGGYLQYLGDQDNPLLSSGQKGLRAITFGSGSTAFALGISALIGCGTSIVCGITAGIAGTATWIFIGQPLIFETLLPNVFQPAKRNYELFSSPEN